MKILAFSDVHHSRSHAEALFVASQGVDLVIGAGDFCNARRNLPDAMNLLGGISKPMIVVPGNAENLDELHEAAHAGTTVLHGTGTEIDGIRIFGLGYGVPTTPFGDWSCDLTETEAAAHLAHCDDCDILVTHSPPKGVADKTSGGLSVGSDTIRAAITRLQPAHALCGHIHDSWGVTGQIGTTLVRNLGPEGHIFEFAP